MPRKNMYIAVVVGVAVVGVFIFLGFFGVKGVTQQPAAQEQNAAGQPANIAQAQELLNEISKSGAVKTLAAIDTKLGTGAEAKAGDTITVNYVGVLPNGTVFDASQAHGKPLTFTLGAGQVIKGWDQGIIGMKVGSTRLLAIPPELAYGNRAMGQIPANASLIFQVELLSIGTPPPEPAPEKK